MKDKDKKKLKGERYVDYVLCGSNFLFVEIELGIILINDVPQREFSKKLEEEQPNYKGGKTENGVAQ